MPATPDALAELIDRQAGVVSRGQLFEHGVELAALRRRLRRRELVTVHPGVYVDHTGPLTWPQRTWAAVLAVEPAALCHRSALRTDDGPGRPGDEVIHLAVDRSRSVAAPPGVRLHRMADLDARVRWNASPPRVRVEHAVLDVAAEASSEMSAIATLADAVQARRTTAARLLDALGERQRIARRPLLVAALTDIAGGTCSALEHAYLMRVERAHGLPTAERQVRASARGPIFRDVEYRRYGLVVELDGRLFHDSANARDRDLERDLLAAVDGRQTVRLGWGQAYERPCSTASAVGGLLVTRGWAGAVRPCRTCLCGTQDPPAGSRVPHKRTG